jgi:hypothetical protein
MFGRFVSAHSRGQKNRTIATAWLRISIALAFVGALSLESENARALELEEPTSQWCLSQRDRGPDHSACYENMLACLLAAFAHGSSCTRRENQARSTDETLTRQASAARHRRRTHSSPQQHQFTAAERNELYRQFKEWRGRSTDE